MSRPTRKRKRHETSSSSLQSYPSHTAAHIANLPVRATTAYEDGRKEEAQRICTFALTRKDLPLDVRSHLTDVLASVYLDKLSLLADEAVVLHTRAQEGSASAEDKSTGGIASTDERGTGMNLLHDDASGQSSKADEAGRLSSGPIALPRFADTATKVAATWALFDEVTSGMHSTSRRPTSHIMGLTSEIKPRYARVHVEDQSVVKYVPNMNDDQYSFGNSATKLEPLVRKGEPTQAVEAASPLPEMHTSKGGGELALLKLQPQLNSSLEQEEESTSAGSGHDVTLVSRGSDGVDKWTQAEQTQTNGGSHSSDLYTLTHVDCQENGTGEAGIREHMAGQCESKSSESKSTTLLSIPFEDLSLSEFTGSDRDQQASELESDTNTAIVARTRELKEADLSLSSPATIKFEAIMEECKAMRLEYDKDFAGDL